LSVAEETKIGNDFVLYEFKHNEMKYSVNLNQKKHFITDIVNDFIEMLVYTEARCEYRPSLLQAEVFSFHKL